MTNMAANSTTVEFDRPEKTVLTGMTPSRPRTIAPARAVIARGTSSVMKKNATNPNTIRVVTAGDMDNPPLQKYFLKMP
jgi:hypothetical protein